jgi:iron complex outermembrane receptor protein
MRVRFRRGTAIAALSLLASSGGLAPAQTPLPEIVVTPSPIVRRAPALLPTGPAPLPPAFASDALRGTLPVVTGQFATVTVVPNEELQRTTGATLGDLLQGKPGITGSSFAPGAASRPVIRGLDAYRVRIQENGLGVNDVSDLADDHAVPIDPLAAQKVEVIRGPATLRWGSQAIGGVVNVENNRIPMWLPPGGFRFETRGATTTVDHGREGGIMLDAGAGQLAVHADAHGRRAGDYRIPAYPYLFPEDPAPVVGDAQPNSRQRSNGHAVGASFIFDGGFVGLGVSHFESLYRVPGSEPTATGTRLDLQQTKVSGRGEVRAPVAGVDAVRFWFGVTDYTHHELANEGGFDGIHQTFTNKANEGRIEVQFAPVNLPFAALTGAVGVQFGRQALTAPGLEGGLFDPNHTKSVAGYLFNELALSDTLRLQLAGRVEEVKVDGSSPDFLVDPDAPILRNREFTPKSAAAGVLQQLPWDIVASLTAQHVERAPRAPELLSRGVHEATGTFDIGNPDLRIEVARSLEVGLRRATGPLRFEATAYWTRYKDFIFRRLTGETCADDFASCTPAGGGGELNQAIYSQRDARFRGAEVQAQLDVAPFLGGMWGIDGQYDTVRATFADGTNVPRIPPQRVGGGIFWRSEDWFARVGVLHALVQDRIAENETRTGSYDLLKAEISQTIRLAPGDHAGREFTWGVVGENLLDDAVRNHVSFRKDEVLLPGRNVRFFARLKY